MDGLEFDMDFWLIRDGKEDDGSTISMATRQPSTAKSLSLPARIRAAHLHIFFPALLSAGLSYSHRPLFEAARSDLAGLAASSGSDFNNLPRFSFRGEKARGHIFFRPDDHRSDSRLVVTCRHWPAA